MRINGSSQNLVTEKQVRNRKSSSAVPFPAPAQSNSPPNSVQNGVTLAAAVAPGYHPDFPRGTGNTSDGRVSRDTPQHQQAIKRYSDVRDHESQTKIREMFSLSIYA